MTKVKMKSRLGWIRGLRGQGQDMSLLAFSENHRAKRTHCLTSLIFVYILMYKKSPYITYSCFTEIYGESCMRASESCFHFSLAEFFFPLREQFLVWIFLKRC